jgi:hypothetical protein
VLLARHGGAWIAIGCAGAALGALTAVLDVRENLGILQVLAQPGEVDEARRRQMRRASETKWSVSAAALAVLSTLFLWKAYWSIAIGVLYLFAAGASSRAFGAASCLARRCVWSERRSSRRSSSSRTAPTRSSTASERHYA